MCLQTPHREQNEASDEDDLSYDLSELKQSARAIYASASATVGQWSTTGSEGGVPLTTSREQELESWVDEVSRNDIGEDDPPPSTESSAGTYFDPQRSNSRNSTLTIFTESSVTWEIPSPKPMSIGSQLIEQGKIYYAQALYEESYQCFDEAYQSVPGVSKDKTGNSKDISEILLKLYLSLSAIRVLHLKPESTNPALSNSTQLWKSTPKTCSTSVGISRGLLCTLRSGF